MADSFFLVFLILTQTMWVVSYLDLSYPRGNLDYDITHGVVYIFLSEGYIVCFGFKERGLTADGRPRYNRGTNW